MHALSAFEQFEIALIVLLLLEAVVSLPYYGNKLSVSRGFCILVLLGKGGLHINFGKSEL